MLPRSLEAPQTSFPRCEFPEADFLVEAVGFSVEWHSILPAPHILHHQIMEETFLGDLQAP